MIKGNKYFEMGKIEEARKLYTAGLNLDCKNAGLFADRSIALLTNPNQNIIQSSQDAQFAVKLDSFNGEYWGILGAAIFYEGELDWALLVLQRAKELAPHSKYVEEKWQLANHEFRNLYDAIKWVPCNPLHVMEAAEKMKVKPNSVRMMRDIAKKVTRKKKYADIYKRSKNRTIAKRWKMDSSL